MIIIPFTDLAAVPSKFEEGYPV